MALSLIRRGVPFASGVGINPIIPVILATDPSNLIQYLPMDESVGATVMVDLSGNSTEGSWAGSGATLSAIAAPGGVGRAALFDGLNDEADIFSAALAALFDKDLGTVSMFGRVFNAGVWTDTTAREMTRLKTDTGKLIDMGRTTTNDQLQVRHFGNGGSRSAAKSGISPTGWFHLLFKQVQFGDDNIEGFYNGTSFGVGAGITTLGGTFSAAFVGSGVGVEYFYGYLAHFSQWKSRISDADILAIAQAGGAA